MVGTANSGSSWQKVCVCDCRGEVCWQNNPNRSQMLEPCGGYSHGPVSDSLPKEKDEYWEIYTREWQELTFFNFLGCCISAEHRTGILSTGVCLTSRESKVSSKRRKYTVSWLKFGCVTLSKSHPFSELYPKNLGSALNKYVLSH